MARSSRQDTRRGGFVYTPQRYELHLANKPDDDRFDLVEMRRQITNLRSQHSDNLLVTSLLNRFFVKIAFLSEPRDVAHGHYLRSELARTLEKIEAIASRSPSGKPSDAVKWPK